MQGLDVLVEARHKTSEIHQAYRDKSFEKKRMKKTNLNSCRTHRLNNKLSDDFLFSTRKQQQTTIHHTHIYRFIIIDFCRVMEIEKQQLIVDHLFRTQRLQANHYTSILTSYRENNLLAIRDKLKAAR